MKDLTPVELHQAINNNVWLQSLELSGFLRGKQKKKTLDVQIAVAFDSLRKQFKDFEEAVAEIRRDVRDRDAVTKIRRKIQKCLADIRNVAGCVFLIIENEEKGAVVEEEQ